MRILFISHYDNPYGANRALISLAGSLKQSGRHEPMVLIPAEGGVSSELREKGISCFIHSVTQWQGIYRERISFGIKKAKRRAAIEKETEEIYELIKDEKIDLIHSNSSVTGTGAMLAEKLGCAHVWHVREFADLHYGMRYFYDTATVTHYYEKADRIVAISDAVAGYVKERFPNASVKRIYDGVESGGYAAAERRSGGPFRFIYAGYLFPAKHQMDVVEAAELLRNRGAGDFEILLAGEGAPGYRAKLVKKIKKSGLEDAVKLCGFVEDMPALLRKCDAGIIASEYEGFGLVSVEYMLSGLPVIGRRSGATPELIEENVCGLLYDDVYGLCEKMEMLIKDRELCRRLADKALLRGRMFSQERNTAEMIGLYDEIDSGR